MVKDPVCGMEIEPEKAADHMQYGSQTFYFCCPVCKEAFQQDPQRYIREKTPEHQRA